MRCKTKAQGQRTLHQKKLQTLRLHQKKLQTVKNLKDRTDEQIFCVLKETRDDMGRRIYINQIKKGRY